MLIQDYGDGIICSLLVSQRQMPERWQIRWHFAQANSNTTVENTILWIILDKSVMLELAYFILFHYPICRKE